MANPSNDKLATQDARARAGRDARETREMSDAARQPLKPVRRRRANDITSAIGLTPITGLSGPKIAY
ncbi:hypothetical protein FNJ84_11325 [Paracoccus sp. M683]|uniref:hypothetical protein n=1 Tax=Paracoccus sp. M683 TaxID=2594268 RepID=UPI00117CE6A7|nr:hypothetical protein [Paracoccus sp. M683]TRW96665.1 hypothetical protein FNJ84_11325 [Paracoccus sp. M683]